MGIRPLIDVILETSEGVERGKFVFLKVPVLFSFRYRTDSLGSGKTLSEESKFTVIYDNNIELPIV